MASREEAVANTVVQVDYMGYRLIAISVLPIDAERTLIYGTRDAGMNVRNSSKQFYDVMLSCARKVA
tara:strand:+ start:327 stop:527 length:201 start_codon:yes stop_codon:yes gene_type:complete